MIYIIFIDSCQTFPLPSAFPILETSSNPLLETEDVSLPQTHIDNYLTVVAQLKKSFEIEPSHEVFRNDFFQFRTELNSVSLNYGVNNRLIAVSAFRISERNSPTIENDFKPYNAGSDFLIDALTTRANDFESDEVQKMISEKTFEKAFEKMQSGLGAHLLQHLCQWEPTQFEVIQAGSRLFSMDSDFLGIFFTLRPKFFFVIFFLGGGQPFFFFFFLPLLSILPSPSLPPSHLLPLPPPPSAGMANSVIKTKPVCFDQRSN